MRRTTKLPRTEGRTLIPRLNIVYRGQLTPELSRIDFLVGAACVAAEEVEFVYLAPEGGASVGEVDDFASEFDNIRITRHIGAGRGMGRHIRADLRGFPDATAERIVIGFSAGSYVPEQPCLAWCVNGIPEERLLHEANARRKAEVALAWARAAIALRPAVTVAVSEPMRRMVERRTRNSVIVVPNAVDRSVFRPGPPSERRFVTYQGGGSPWQGLGRLAEVWSELSRLDASLRFRVISNDPRTSVLLDGIDPGRAEAIGVSTAAEVAGLLREASIGFLFREPNAINRAAWPMKLGEYLAAGAPVVVSRCGWDADAFVAEHRAGVVVDWHADPSDVAARVHEQLTSPTSYDEKGIERAAASLDRDAWSSRLTTQLIEAHAKRTRTPV